MVDVTVDTIIERAPADVAAYASDPTNAPEWYVKIESAEWQTEPPVEVGSQIAFVAQFLGKEMRYTYEVVEHTPAMQVMRTSEGPFPMETTYRFDETADGHTKVTLRNRGTPTGFSRMGAPLMAKAMRKSMTADLQALKQRLENDHRAA